MNDLTLAINLALHPTTLFLAYLALTKLPRAHLQRTLHPSPRTKQFWDKFQIWVKHIRLGY
ncbi:hypothetical protein [Nostoc sp.]|uniref:hypothetical protein n=1 Tax=Nostoc sp. TaxID=1180 RepID=UPI002FF54FE8